MRSNEIKMNQMKLQGGKKVREIIQNLKQINTSDF